jgi:hypothetical protein
MLYGNSELKKLQTFQSYNAASQLAVNVMREYFSNAVK